MWEIQTLQSGSQAISFLAWEPNYMATYLVWTNEDKDRIRGLYHVIHVKTAAYHQLKEKLEVE